MIHFQITQSPDQNVISSYQYYQNQVYLGKQTGDLLINDSDFLPSHVMIEVIGNDLIVHPQKGVTHFLINGKRATTVRKVKLQDVITIGKTDIKIISFEETPKQTKKEILDTKLEMLINENSQRLAVIESLTKRMK